MATHLTTALPCVCVGTVIGSCIIHLNNVSMYIETVFEPPHVISIWKAVAVLEKSWIYTIQHKGPMLLRWVSRTAVVIRITINRPAQTSWNFTSPWPGGLYKFLPGVSPRGWGRGPAGGLLVIAAQIYQLGGGLNHTVRSLIVQYVCRSKKSIIE